MDYLTDKKTSVDIILSRISIDNELAFHYLSTLLKFITKGSRINSWSLAIVTVCVIFLERN